MPHIILLMVKPNALAINIMILLFHKIDDQNIIFLM